MRRIFPLAVLLVVLLIWIIRFHRQHLSGLRSSDESALNSCASCVAAGFAWQMRSCQMSIPQDKLKPEVTHSPDVYCRKMLEPAACYTTSSQCVAFEAVHRVLVMQRVSLCGWFLRLAAAETAV